MKKVHLKLQSYGNFVRVNVIEFNIHNYAMLCSSSFILILYQPLAIFPATASPTSTLAYLSEAGSGRYTGISPVARIHEQDPIGIHCHSIEMNKDMKKKIF